MQLNNYFWYFQKAIPERICDQIIQYGNSKEDKLGVTGKYEDKKLNKKEIIDLKKKRNSNVVFLSDSWIYKEIHPYIHLANQNAGWNFQWDYSEPCQFTKYKKGQYYDWHCDGSNKPYSKKELGIGMYGKVRKLSVTVSLSDTKDYSGGELEFDFRENDPNKKRHIVKCTQILPKGSLVVFPSFVWHRVCKVKKGHRYSLVIWNLGWPFK
jgi:PKHD-type hydroxylase